MIGNQSVETIQVGVAVEDGVHVVAIRGTLADEANVSARELLLRVLAGKPSRLVVDLSAMEYISSSGIGLLVSVLRRCREGGIPMSLCGLRPEILVLFKMIRLDQVFDIRADRRAALAKS